jgi:hypothetical protein
MAVTRPKHTRAKSKSSAGARAEARAQRRGWLIISNSRQRQFQRKIASLNHSAAAPFMRCTFCVSLCGRLGTCARISRIISPQITNKMCFVNKENFGQLTARERDWAFTHTQTTNTFPKWVINASERNLFIQPLFARRARVCFNLRTNSFCEIEFVHAEKNNNRRNDNYAAALHAIWINIPNCVLRAQYILQNTKHLNFVWVWELKISLVFLQKLKQSNEFFLQSTKS